ncbi:MAG: helical backbone metal receptor [Acidobacteriota bacterium]
MPAQRVVSLCPSITETLVEIGALPRLAAATRYCTRPRGVLRGVPRIGGTKDPDIAKVLALKPDLVFANQEENRREDVQAFEAAGIPVDVTFPTTVGQVPRDVRQWGRLLGGPCEAQAEALASRIERALSEARSGPPPDSFRYAYWIWKDPWMTVSGATYVADLLRLAGGVNAYAEEAERYPKSTPAEALARGARVHLFPSEPYPFRRARHDEAMRKLFGTESRRLFVEGDDFCWHGARTLAGLSAVGQLRRQLTRGG